MELKILDFIYEKLRTPIGDAVMSYATRLGDSGAVWIAWAFILFCFPEYRKVGTAIALALTMEYFACNIILKNLFARIRPYDVSTAIELLIEEPHGFSFPSGHTGASFAAASVLFFEGDRFRIPAILLASLIAFSRIYLYVHYPTDVLGGMMLGAVFGYVAWYMFCRVG